MSHDISLAAAADLTARFRTINPGRELAQSFPREVYEDLLADPTIKGIKIYNGLDNEGNYHLVLVGYKDGSSANTSDELAIIKQFSTMYPPETCEPNDLNS